MKEENKLLSEQPVTRPPMTQRVVRPAMWTAGPCYQIIKAWLGLGCDDFEAQRLGLQVESPQFMDQEEYGDTWGNKCLRSNTAERLKKNWPANATWWSQNKFKVYGLKAYKTKKATCKEGVETARAGTAETATIKKIYKLVDDHRSAPRIDQPSDVRVSKEEQKIKITFWPPRPQTGWSLKHFEDTADYRIVGSNRQAASCETRGCGVSFKKIQAMVKKGKVDIAKFTNNVADPATKKTVDIGDFALWAPSEPNHDWYNDAVTDEEFPRATAALMQKFDNADRYGVVKELAWTDIPEAWKALEASKIADKIRGAALNRVSFKKSDWQREGIPVGAAAAAAAARPSTGGRARRGRVRTRLRGQFKDPRVGTVQQLLKKAFAPKPAANENKLLKEQKDPVTGANLKRYPSGVDSWMGTITFASLQKIPALKGLVNSPGDVKTNLDQIVTKLQACNTGGWTGTCQPTAATAAPGGLQRFPKVGAVAVPPTTKLLKWGEVQQIALHMYPDDPVAGMAVAIATELQKSIPTDGDYGVVLKKVHQILGKKGADYTQIRKDMKRHHHRRGTGAMVELEKYEKWSTSSTATALRNAGIFDKFEIESPRHPGKMIAKLPDPLRRTKKWSVFAATLSANAKAVIRHLNIGLGESKEKDVSQVLKEYAQQTYEDKFKKLIGGLAQ